MNGRPFNFFNEFDDIADAIATDAAELPDRTSPDDYPDMLMLTAEELTSIVHRRLRENPTFQARVASWMLECFTTEIAADKVERNDRFIEEALELVQSLGYGRDRAHALVDYVFDRPIGDPDQEVGGVMVTLAALCQPNALDMQMSAEVELRRISQSDVIAKIRAKQAGKPTGSALPIAILSAAPALPAEKDGAVQVAATLLGSVEHTLERHVEALQQRLVDAIYGPGQKRTDSVSELVDALIALAAIIPSERGDGVVEQRRQCASSGFHDHDGCSCSDAELAARATLTSGQGVTILPRPTGWHDISTAPEGYQILVWETDYGWLLACKNRHHPSGWGIKGSGNFYADMPESVVAKLTHWRPIGAWPGTGLSDLVKRLQATAAQLRKMADQASFGGEATGVRVKDPALLLADLDEAAAALVTAHG